MSIVEANVQVKLGGIAKSSQYALIFSNIKDLLPSRVSKRLSISCEECFFPGMNIYTADVRHYGHQMKYPYGREYSNEVTMIFRVGADFFEKRIFEEWIQSIVDQRSDDHEYYDNYTSDIQILQIADTIDPKRDSDKGIIDGIIDKFKEAIDINFGLGQSNTAKPFIPVGQEEVSYRCVLENAFPIGMMELPMGHGNQNTYHRVGVTFTFRKWYAVPIGYSLNQFDASQQAEADALSSKEKRGIGGKIIDIATRGGQVYGKVFGRGSGGNNIQF